jgi:UDP-glucose 4-epimerase
MILLTGATGYIGSHTWIALHAAGMPVVGLDDFSNSSPEVLRRLAALGADVSRFAEVDVTNRAALAEVFERWPIDAVVHFAAKKAVGESVANPLLYYANNVGGTVALAQAMQAHGCRRIVFSSTATVYGQPRSLPVREDAALAPSSPYASTKLMSENILKDVERADPAWRSALLRYFNPVGAHSERHDRRRPARHAEQPDALRGPGRRRQARAPLGLRQRLRDAGRQRRARLPARAGPGRGPRRGAEAPARRRRLADAQPRHGARRQRLRAGEGVRAGERPPVPYEIAPRRAGDVAAYWPIRRSPSGCSAGKPGSASTRCAPTAGAGSRPTRTASRPPDPTAGPSRGLSLL